MHKIVTAAAIVVLSLSLTITAYAVVRQIIDRADPGIGYVYVASDEHFIEYPEEALIDSNSGVIVHESDGEIIVEYYDDRFIETKDISLEEAFIYIGSDFSIPEGFGLSVVEVNLLDDLYLGSKQVMVVMESDYGAREISSEGHVQSYNGANITYFINTITDESSQITVGMPGTIEELVINGVTVHKMIVSGESLGIDDYPYSFIWMMWKYNGLAYRIFCNDITWITEEIELLTAGVLPG